MAKPPQRGTSSASAKSPLSVVRNSRVRKPKPSAHKFQPGAIQPAPSTFLPLAELKPNCVYIARYQLYDGQDITNAPKHHCILQSVDTLFGKVTIIPITTLGGRTPEEYWTERATLTKKPNDVYHQFEYLPFGRIGNKGAAIIECQPPTVKGFIHFPQSVIIDYATVTAAGKLRHPGSLKPPNQATHMPPWGLEYIRRARSKWGKMSEQSIVAGRWPRKLKRLTKKFSASNPSYRIQIHGDPTADEDHSNADEDNSDADDQNMGNAEEDGTNNDGNTGAGNDDDSSPKGDDDDSRKGGVNSDTTASGDDSMKDDGNSDTTASGDGDRLYDSICTHQRECSRKPSPPEDNGSAVLENMRSMWRGLQNGKYLSASVQLSCLELNSVDNSENDVLAMDIAMDILGSIGCIQPVR